MELSEQFDWTAWARQARIWRNWVESGDHDAEGKIPSEPFVNTATILALYESTASAPAADAPAPQENHTCLECNVEMNLQCPKCKRLFAFSEATQTLWTVRAATTSDAEPLDAQ